MKKILITPVLMLCLYFSKAQHFNSIQVIPANPTTADTIYVIADMWFSSGTCDQQTQQSFVSGNTIFCSTLHCTGMLTVICNDVDTFKINPLPSGNYTINVQVDAGGLPSPCTPGIVAGETDSVSITVFPVVGINDTVEMSRIFISITDNILLLKNLAYKEDLLVTVNDAKGQAVVQKLLFKNELKIPFSKSKGIYFVKIENKTGKSETRKIVVVK